MARNQTQWVEEGSEEEMHNSERLSTGTGDESDEGENEEEEEEEDDEEEDEEEEGRHDYSYSEEDDEMNEEAVEASTQRATRRIDAKNSQFTENVCISHRAFVLC